MVVDVSSSMKDHDITEAKKAALAMCGELESRDKVSSRIGIVTFDKTAHDLTNGLVSVTEAKKAIGAVSYTHLDVYKRQPWSHPQEVSVTAMPMELWYGEKTLHLRI